MPITPREIVEAYKPSIQPIPIGSRGVDNMNSNIAQPLVATLDGSALDRLLELVTLMKHKSMSDAGLFFSKNGKLWFMTRTDSTPLTKFLLPICDYDDMGHQFKFVFEIKDLYNLIKKAGQPISLEMSAKDPNVLKCAIVYKAGKKKTVETLTASLKAITDTILTLDETDSSIEDDVALIEKNPNCEIVLGAKDFSDGCSISNEFRHNDVAREHLCQGYIFQLDDNMLFGSTNGIRLGILEVAKPYIVNKSSDDVAPWFLLSGNAIAALKDIPNIYGAKSVSVKAAHFELEQKAKYGNYKTIEETDIVRFNIGGAIVITRAVSYGSCIYAKTPDTLRNFLINNNKDLQLDRTSNPHRVELNYDDVAKIHKLGKCFEFYKSKNGSGRAIHIVNNPDGNVELIMGVKSAESEHVSINIGDACKTDSPHQTLVSLNAEYLQDTLLELKKLNDADKFTLSIGDGLSPVIVRSGRILTVVMPMRA